MYVMSSGDESYAEPMSTYMLEDICNGSQSHPRKIGERRATRYVMALNEVKRNGKERYYLCEIWVNIYTRYLRPWLIRFRQALPILGESEPEVSYFVP